MKAKTANTFSAEVRAWLRFPRSQPINAPDRAPMGPLAVQPRDAGAHILTIHADDRMAIALGEEPLNACRDVLAERGETGVRAAQRSVTSKSGKELLRRRGPHIERSFAHILDAGGMRRTTLRGWENLNKRFKLAAAFYNLSQRMRKLFGFGTPKQLAAAVERSAVILFTFGI